LRDIINRALNQAQLHQAQYADIRVVHNLTETLVVKNGIAEEINFAESNGFGVRVLLDGGWGFASSHDISRQEVVRVTDLAISIARASSRGNGAGVGLGPPVTSQGRYQTPIEIDPFELPQEEKLAVLLTADSEMAGVLGVRVRRSNLTFIKENKWFANTEGAFTEQTIYEAGGGIQAVAIGGGEVQTRSYPSSFGRQQVTSGWEAVLDWDLPGNAQRIAGEAVALLTADPCPSDLNTTLILGGDQVALQIHESCGHPIELDRVFGTEA
jgi:TldD protein